MTPKKKIEDLETRETCPDLIKGVLVDGSKKQLGYPQSFKDTLSIVKGKTEEIVPSCDTKTPAQRNSKEYASVDELKKIINQQLKGKKFMLDCGHRVTFGYFLGNDIIIRNGKKFEIVCSDCGY